jgi:hypothetical protein
MDLNDKNTVITGSSMDTGHFDKNSDRLIGLKNHGSTPP